MPKSLLGLFFVYLINKKRGKKYIPETRDAPLSSSLDTTSTAIVVPVTVVAIVRYYGSGVIRRRRVCSISNCK
jgi:hypothetical protein